jgi:hypothetical protein
MTVFSLRQDPDVDMDFVVMSSVMLHTPVDQSFGSRSGLRRAKMTHTNRKRFRNILCFEGLDVLFYGLKASPVAWTAVMEN